MCFALILFVFREFPDKLRLFYFQKFHKLTSSCSNVRVRFGRCRTSPCHIDPVRRVDVTRGSFSCLRCRFLSCCISYRCRSLPALLFVVEAFLCACQHNTRSYACARIRFCLLQRYLRIGAFRFRFDTRCFRLFECLSCAGFSFRCSSTPLVPMLALYFCSFFQQLPATHLECLLLKKSLKKSLKHHNRHTTRRIPCSAPCYIPRARNARSRK